MRNIISSLSLGRESLLVHSPPIEHKNQKIQGGESEYCQKKHPARIGGEEPERDDGQQAEEHAYQVVGPIPGGPGLACLTWGVSSIPIPW